MALLDYLPKQTAPMHVRPGSNPDQDMQSRYLWLLAGIRSDAQLSTAQPARMADSCFINCLDEDGRPYWKVVTIETWKEYGGVIK